MQEKLNKIKEYIKKDNFEYQGRSQKQYQDSSKIFLIAAAGLFILITFSVLYDLILG